MKKILATALAATALVACAPQQDKSEDAAEQPKALILYYSQTGATQAVAEELQAQLGADIEAIEVEVPYDGSYDETIERCKKEMETGDMPAIKPIKADLSQYEVIFLGFPVWFGTYAPPIASLIKEQAFEGKKVVTFCTFGSGGLQASTANLKEALPKAEVVEGYGVRHARLDAVKPELERFLIEGGYKQGEIEALPAFMEQHPVSDEEKKIFDEACGNYQFPLGTPVAVAGRTTPLGTEYLYDVDSKDHEGNPAKSQIIILVPNYKDPKPEFTQVIR